MQSLIFQLLAIGIVLGSLVVLWKLQQRGMLRITRANKGNSPEAVIRVITRKPLTSQHALFLVNINENLLLIGTSPQSCQLLDKVKSVSPSSEAPL